MTSKSIYPSNFYAYLYRDIDGTPIYIGKGTGRRAYIHFKSKSHLGNLLRNRLKESFKIEPEFLCQDVDEELAFFVEEEMIRKYGRKDLALGTLFNLTDGGDGVSGYKHSDKTKTKIQKTMRGIPNVGGSAKGIPTTGKAAKGVPKVGNNAKGMPNIGGSAKGVPKVGKNAKGVPKTGKNVKGTHRLKSKCPHCNILCSNAMLIRWHGDNCKLKF